jgi:hypothetical protein
MNHPAPEEKAPREGEIDLDFLGPLDDDENATDMNKYVLVFITSICVARFFNYFCCCP